jgi:tetratricopeptide (TPR) repeat protein
MTRGPVDRWRWPLAYAAVGTALVAFAFVLHLRSELVWDDVHLVAQSPLIHDPHGLIPLITHDLWGAATGGATQLYHPVPMATVWLQARVSTDPAFYRSFNVLAHVSCAALFLVWTTRRVGGSGLLAALVSIVFLVHPSVTEVVEWITGRHDSLATLAVLGALLLWPHDGSVRLGRMAVASLLVLVAFFCKEPYVVAPVILALCQVHREWSAGRKLLTRASAALALPFGAVAIGFAVRAALHIPSSSDQLHASVGAHLRSYATILAHYAAQLGTFANGRTTESWAPLSDAACAAVLAACIAVVVLLVWAARRGSTNAATALLGCAWFAVALLPHVVSLPAIGMFGNRYAYFPLLGFCLVLGSAIRSIAVVVEARVPRLRVPLLGAAGALVLLMTLQTAVEVSHWRDETTLFGADVEAAPDDPRSLYHLATAVGQRSGCGAAIPLYEHAVASDPGYQRAWHNLAGCLIDERRWPDAVLAGQRALDLGPDGARDEFNLGIALLGAGRQQEGLRHLERANQLDPSYAPAREALAHAPR